MKAHVVLKNLKCATSLKILAEKLSAITDLTEIKVNLEAAMVSFRYYSDEAALRVYQELTSLSCHSCPGKA